MRQEGCGFLLDRHRMRARQKRSRETAKFCHSSLLTTVIQVILCLLLISQVTSSKRGFEVARFIDEERLEACNLDLARSAGDDDKLDSKELVDLVGSLSQGRISVEKFRDLPLRLRMIYHWTACSCVFEPNASLDCCLGDAAHVNIQEAESTLPFLLNRIFCSELTRGITKVEDSYPALPTAAPSVTPSTSPTVAPSSSPTTSPSSTPSASPTAEESASPTEEPPPTTSPTIHPTTSPTSCKFQQHNTASLL